MTNFFTTAIIVFYSIYTNAQLFNRVVPPVIKPYSFIKYGVVIPGTYIMSPVTVHPTRPGTGQQIEPEVLFDSNGNVLWYGCKPGTVLNTDFKFHSEHKLFSYCACVDSVTYIYYILDSKLNIIDSVVNLNGVKPDAHDFIILSNGNYLLAGRLDSIADLSTCWFNGQQGARLTSIMGFVLQEINRKHELVWQWNSNEHINPTAFIDQYGYNSSHFDYCHGNSISIASDGNYILSFRNLDAAYKIDRISGDIIWELGGKHSTFLFTDTNTLSGQHHVQQLPNGNIIAFNNGNTMAVKQSRIVEYELDTVEKTASLVWSSPARSGFYAVGMGSIQKNDEGTKVIGCGQVYRPTPSVMILDSKDSLNAEFYFKDSVMSYRTYYFKDGINFKRPAIKVKKLKSEVYLVAPSGYKHYTWSTGETTKSIKIEKEGTYMVWVNFGVGMLGSLPINISAHLSKL